MTVDNFEPLPFEMKVIVLNFFLFMTHIYYFAIDNQVALFQFFRAELGMYYTATEPESMGSLLLTQF